VFQADQLPGAQNIDIPQLPQIAAPIINIRMAEEKALLPAPFSGYTEEDPSEFWRRLTTYLGFKGVDDNAEKLKLAKALLVQDAADWLEGLDPAQKGTFDQLKDAFEKHYIKPTALRFRSASEMFKKRQAPNETVDAYAARVRNLSKRVAVTDTTLLYAFVSGLKPQIATFVLGRNPESMNAAVNDARIAEMSQVETTSSDNSLLTEQVAQMRNDLQKLTQRYDSIALSAPVTDRSRSPVSSSTKWVAFQEPPQQSQRPYTGRPPSPAARYYPPQQHYGNFRPPYRGGRGRLNSGSFRGARAGPQVPFERGLGSDRDRKCNKCGLNQHTNVNFCPAINQQCTYCAKYGHFRRVCRAARRD